MCYIFRDQQKEEVLWPCLRRNFEKLCSKSSTPKILASVEIIPFMMQELKTTRRAMLDAQERVNQIVAKLPEIDSQISSASTEYTFERISSVEKTILRLSLFELLFDPTIPPKVSIAEAVRLCRKFGTPESSQFVNALLDNVYKSLPAPVSV